jgi:hypothetical protein
MGIQMVATTLILCSMIPGEPSGPFLEGHRVSTDEIMRTRLIPALRIQLGMSEDEVTAILGFPSSIFLSLTGRCEVYHGAGVCVQYCNGKVSWIRLNEARLRR